MCTCGYGHCGLLSREVLCGGVFIQLAFIFSVSAGLFGNPRGAKLQGKRYKEAGEQDLPAKGETSDGMDIIAGYLSRPVHR